MIGSPDRYSVNDVSKRKLSMTNHFLTFSNLLHATNLLPTIKNPLTKKKKKKNLHRRPKS